jgi:hypothetical protein
MFYVKIQVAISMFWFFSSSSLWPHHHIELNKSCDFLLFVQVPSTVYAHVETLCWLGHCQKPFWVSSITYSSAVCRWKWVFLFLSRITDLVVIVDLHSNDGAHHKFVWNGSNFYVLDWIDASHSVLLFWRDKSNFWNSEKTKRNKVTRKCRGSWALLFTEDQRKIDSWRFFYLGIR